MNTSLSLSGVSSGWWYGCARAAVNPTQSINAYCWGYNDDGQLGDGTSGTARNSPVLVQGVTNVTVIDAGVLHTCALTDQRAVYCWGANAKGQLGDGTTTLHTSAVRVAP